MAFQEQTLSIDQAKERQEELRRDFGKKLCQSRQLVGLSKQDLTHLTRISMVFIDALENGNFKAMPGEVFGRGFVRNICKVIGLDAEEYLGLFSEAWKEPENLVQIHKKNSPFSSTSKKSGGIALNTTYAEPAASKHFLSENSSWLSAWLNPKRLGLVFVSVVSISAVLAGLGRFLRNQEATPALTPVAARSVPEVSQPGPAASPQPETASTPIIATAPDDVLPKTAEQGSTSPVQTAALNEDALREANVTEEKPAPELAEPKATTSLAAPTADVSHVLVKVKEPVELKIKRNSTDPLETKVYEVGEFNFEIQDQGMIHITNAAAVEVLLNGKSLGTLGNLGQSRKLKFSQKPLPQAKTP